MSAVFARSRRFSLLLFVLIVAVSMSQFGCDSTRQECETFIDINNPLQEELQGVDFGVRGDKEPSEVIDEIEQTDERVVRAQEELDAVDFQSEELKGHVADYEEMLEDWREVMAQLAEMLEAVDGGTAELMERREAAEEQLMSDCRDQQTPDVCAEAAEAVEKLYLDLAAQEQVETRLEELKELEPEDEAIAESIDEVIEVAEKTASHIEKIGEQEALIEEASRELPKREARIIDAVNDVCQNTSPI